jgi:tRNA U34 5-methylaminomethyl-2-thiouridine-forming methyltransferase MnmC
MKFIQSDDGSFTMFSERFREHYHSTRDGALSESLYKHIIPALSLTTKNSIQILDISFGLGFNSLTTLYSLWNSKKSVEIHSPEIDEKLVKSLRDFPYPKIFEPLESIILEIAETGKYESERFKIYVHFKDGREFLKEWNGGNFDIVFQDAFSPKNSPEFWTVEYFKEIKRVIACNGILTTYSSATPIRMALFENGFHIYTYEHQKVRSGTIASLNRLEELEEIDMERKKVVSTNWKPLRDEDIAIQVEL